MDKEQDRLPEKVYVVMYEYLYEGDSLVCVFGDQARAQAYCDDKNATDTSLGEYFLEEQEVL